ncbi:Uncharacterised protein [uncultured archaeon]|nr:Uncharacterised protein [uncultured archaeon]
MAEAVKKAVKKEKPVKPDENAAKEAAKATLQALSKPKDKAVAVKAPSSVQAAPKEKAVEAVKKAVPLVKPEAAKVEAIKEAPKPEAQAKPEAPKAEAKAEITKEEAAPQAEAAKPKTEAKKEADPNKEFVDGIMTEMNLKGASKKRLIKMLGEQYNFDRHRVLFKLKRALITERYAAAHEAAGH